MSPRRLLHPARAERLQSGAALRLVLLCFFLSGAAGLLYQTAWLRQFSAVFGTSELAVATVLASYMGGLALGAAIARRTLMRIGRLILAYGLLEGGIAVSALAVPWMLEGAGLLYESLLGGQPAPPAAADIHQSLFYVVVAFLVLALPTACMGATLPLLARHAVQHDAELGSRVALLYAVNTAGAVAGTLLTAFLLLPVMGLTATVWVGVGTNALIFAIATGLARGQPALPPLEAAAAETPIANTTDVHIVPLSWRGPGAAPAVMFASGAVAFLYEVLWTRLLAHVIGGSIQAFATMLAAFLAGIAIGSLAIGPFAKGRREAAAYLSLTQVGIAVLALGAYLALSWQGTGIETRAEIVVSAFAVMLPAAAFIGATFPLAVRLLARDAREVGEATAKVYAWNTTGAIVGALTSAFVIVPGLGFEGAMQLAVALNLGLALWIAALVAEPSPRFAAAALAALACTLVAVLFYTPPRPQAVVYRAGLNLEELPNRLERFYRVGRSSTVLLLESDGRHFLRTNGLQEAVIEARGAWPVLDPTHWLSALPLLARPAADSLLLVGFGGGVALEGLPASLQRIDAIELEPAVIAANQSIAGKRARDPLADPRLSIVINDARNALRLTDRRYDIIISQPSHPWTAGASHLFTREYFAEISTHLSNRGVFVQWMNSEYLDLSLLRSLAATLMAEFPHVRLYQPSPQVLVFLAAADRLDLELDLAAGMSRRWLLDPYFERAGLRSLEDLVAALALDEEGLRNFAGAAQISTDDRNLMAVGSRYASDGLGLPELAAAFAPYDPLLKPSGWLHARLGHGLALDYVVARLLRLGQRSRAGRLAEALPEGALRATAAGLLAREAGNAEAARRAFETAVRQRPDWPNARYLAMEMLPTAHEAAQSGHLEALAASRSPATAVALGWQRQSAGDWAALAQLDPVLGQSRPVDPWAAEALRLRAEWRLRVTREASRYAAEALELIDRAAAVAPSFDLALLRLMAGVQQGDADVSIESARAVIGYIDATLTAAASVGIELAPSSLHAPQQNLEAIVATLEEGVGAHDHRGSELLARARALLLEIDRLQ